MQKKLPKIYLFVEDFNSSYLNNLNKNISIIYRNYMDQHQNASYASIQDQVSLISLNILKYLTEPKEMWFSQARDCLGRRMCELVKKDGSTTGQTSTIENVLLKLTR